jgi:signal peptidase I
MRFLKGFIDFLMDILETITFVGSIFVVVYLFIMQPNQVKGPSMEPSFYTGEYIFTSKITYRLRSYEYGDVVVFRAPDNPDKEYIKRVIALPGDTIEVSDGQVLVNNQVQRESYIAAQTTLISDGYLRNNEPQTVPEGYLFVMGDNRPRSSDSREFGPITQESVIGQVFYRYFPADRIGWIENPHQTRSASTTNAYRALARTTIVP